MLVLTRKYQEKIRIGDNITITVLRTKGKAVRLGIEAPANVPVVRGELKFESEESTKSPQLSRRASRHADSSARKADSPGRRRVCVDDSISPGATSRQHGLPEAEIEHRRVPRGKVGQVLPRLIPGNGALRELLRSAVGDRLMPWHAAETAPSDAVSAVDSTRIRFAPLRYVNRQHSCSPAIWLRVEFGKFSSSANCSNSTRRTSSMLCGCRCTLLWSAGTMICERNCRISIQPSAGERNDAVAVADQVLAPARVRIVPDHIVVRHPRARRGR